MDKWLQYLTDRGAQLANDTVVSFGETTADYAKLCDTISFLSDQALLSVTGPDSRKFLQGQTTCDFMSLQPGTSLRGAICNPKGRMIVSFQAHLTSDDVVLLSLAKGLAATLLTVLTRYAAFYKTDLKDVSDQYCQFGLCGPMVETALHSIFPAVPPVNCSSVDTAGNILTCLDTNLYVVITGGKLAPALWGQLSTELQQVGEPWWQLQLIQAGLASISADLSEKFVPQMLNMQATNGVSFTKGCYTGQEVVARMQYLGSLKRRTYLIKVHSAQLPGPGTEIFSSDDAKVVGTVLQAAPTDSDNYAMLAVLRETALDQSEFVIDGLTVPVNFVNLPYEITSR
jgi:tRNA-modifying protein YgfZ